MRRSRGRLKEPFGKAGLTVAICALILGMVGGAYAATKLNGTQKKEVEKIAKKYAGKPGANGAQGAAGPAGPKGDAGSKGDKGDAGGAGESVTISSASAGECKEGGAKFSNASGTKHACNGSPWTAGGTLPSEASEAGTWSFGGTMAPAVSPLSPLTSISFPIPLASPLADETEVLAGEHFHVFKEEETPPTGCSGGHLAKLEADPGNFCLFISGGTVEAAELLPFTAEFSEIGIGRSGLMLTSLGFAAGSFAFGTWAVTAP